MVLPTNKLCATAPFPHDVGMAIAPDALESLTAKFAVLLPHLDERQQRLYLGAEARSLGRGGITAVARAAGVSRQTVADGVAELDRGQAPAGRIRRSGGGRKRLTDLDPSLLPALLVLIEPGTVAAASPLRWTTKSTRKLAEELTGAGHRIAADTVANLLREEGFTLHAGARTLAGGPPLNRTEQFRHVNEQAAAHHAAGDPAIHVVTRKLRFDDPLPDKGDWRPNGDPAWPAGLLYGARESAADHDTMQFAVESIRRWWHGQSRHGHPDAPRFLVVADMGTPDDLPIWRAGLTALATETGRTITLAHLPPGTSKWNSIEHRSFSSMTTTSPDRPGTTHEILVADIGKDYGNPATFAPPPATLPPADWNLVLRPDR